MLRLKDFNIDDKNEYNFFICLYNNSFPLEERRAISDVKFLLITEKKFKVKIIWNNQNQMIGLLCFWTFDDFIYAEHLAIDSNIRNAGYGTQAVNLFLSEINLPLILEIELPEDDISIRRLEFYQRLGFKIWTEINYIQPPYHLTTSSVEMKLLTKGDIDLTDCFDNIKKQLYSAVYKIEI